MIFITLL